MKEWISAPCAYCGTTIPFVKVADVMKVKCRKCSRLQTINLPKKIVKIPKVIEEPKVISKSKIIDRPIKKKENVVDINKSIDYRIGE